jgi:hypothetical protein
LKRKRAIAKKRAEAIKDATSVRLNPDQLNPVERRTVELLRGQPPKPKKNLIEERAIRLAGLIKRDWGFSKKRKSHISLAHDKLQQILQVAREEPEKQAAEPIQAIQLTINDVVSIAAPIIEEFAQAPISLHKFRSGSDPASFDALYSVVCAYAHDGTTCKKLTINQALRRFRKRESVQTAQNEDLRVDIAPELRAWMQ